MSARRKDVRHAVAESLAAFLTGSLTILPYQPTKLEGSPIVTVLSAGSARPSLTGLGNKSEFDLAVNHFILRSGENWTEQQAEDAMDDLDEQMADWLVKFKGKTMSWDAMELLDRSGISLFVPEGGKVYLKETYTIRIVVFG